MGEFPPAGWYPDPTPIRGLPYAVRLWDGAAWRDDVRWWDGLDWRRADTRYAKWTGRLNRHRRAVALVPVASALTGCWLGALTVWLLAAVRGNHSSVNAISFVAPLVAALIAAPLFLWLAALRLKR